jgi:hypothetical protein
MSAFDQNLPHEVKPDLSWSSVNVQCHLIPKLKRPKIHRHSGILLQICHIISSPSVGIHDFDLTHRTNKGGFTRAYRSSDN